MRNPEVETAIFTAHQYACCACCLSSWPSYSVPTAFSAFVSVVSLAKYKGMW
jgi:hypothetical protein